MGGFPRYKEKQGPEAGLGGGPGGGALASSLGLLSVTRTPAGPATHPCCRCLPSLVHCSAWSLSHHEQTWHRFRNALMKYFVNGEGGRGAGERSGLAKLRVPPFPRHKKTCQANSDRLGFSSSDQQCKSSPAGPAELATCITWWSSS